MSLNSKWVKIQNELKSNMVLNPNDFKSKMSSNRKWVWIQNELKSKISLNPKSV